MYAWLRNAANVYITPRAMVADVIPVKTWPSFWWPDNFY